MTITSKTVKCSAEAKLDEFVDVKELLTHLDGGWFSYINDYVIAYVLLKNYGYDAVKISDVNIDIDTNTVFIEFESKIEND